MELKKLEDYDHQIQHLKDKNIVVSDLNAARTFLMNVNYYRFSGYFLPFKKRERNGVLSL